MSHGLSEHDILKGIISRHDGLLLQLKATHLQVRKHNTVEKRLLSTSYFYRRVHYLCSLTIVRRAPAQGAPQHGYIRRHLGSFKHVDEIRLRSNIQC